VAAGVGMAVVPWWSVELDLYLYSCILDSYESIPCQSGYRMLARVPGEQTFTISAYACAM